MRSGTPREDRVAARGAPQPDGAVPGAAGHGLRRGGGRAGRGGRPERPRYPPAHGSDGGASTPAQAAERGAGHHGRAACGGGAAGGHAARAAVTRSSTHDDKAVTHASTCAADARYL